MSAIQAPKENTPKPRTRSRENASSGVTSSDLRKYRCSLSMAKLIKAMAGKSNTLVLNGVGIKSSPVIANLITN